MVVEACSALVCLLLLLADRLRAQKFHETFVGTQDGLLVLAQRSIVEILMMCLCCFHRLLSHGGWVLVRL